MIANLVKIRKFGLLNTEGSLRALQRSCGLLIGITDGQTDRLNGYDFINNGTTITIADKYAEVIAADTTNILYDELGEPKTLVIADTANVINEQFFFYGDSDKILFFDAPLTGDCKYKAYKFMEFNEPYFVSDGGGGFEPYTVNGEQMYIVKEGVIVE